jgi:hypothetical protein
MKIRYNEITTASNKNLQKKYCLKDTKGFSITSGSSAIHGRGVLLHREIFAV